MNIRNDTDNGHSPYEITGLNAILLRCLAVEDERTIAVICGLIRLQEITPFFYGNSDDAQKVYIYRQRSEVDAIIFVFTSPTHIIILTGQDIVGKRNPFHSGYVFQTTAHSINRLAGKSTHIRYYQRVLIIPQRHGADKAILQEHKH